MIYLPSDSPTPERPPSINREIVGVLLAMACISGLLVHYTRDTWCDLPGLSAFCLPPLIAQRPDSPIPDGADGVGRRATGSLSRPAAPGSTLATPSLVDSSGAPSPGIPTPAGFPTPRGADMSGLAYPPPGSDMMNGGFPNALVTPGGSAPLVAPAATAPFGSFTTVGENPDYPATATALAQSSAARSTSTPATAEPGTTPTQTSGDPGPTSTATLSSAYP